MATTASSSSAVQGAMAPVSLITGGSRGLGRSAALHVARAGGDVILTYRGARAEADAVVAQLASVGRRAVALQLDVGEVAGFAAFQSAVRQTLAESFGGRRLHGLVNNAGVGVHAAFADTTEAQFDQLMHVHFKGVFFLTQALLPLLADGGRIVNISTGLTRFSYPGYAAYASMKGAVEVITRYLAKELGPRGIAVNTLAPGAIETDFGGGVVRDDAGVNAAVASQIALGRVGRPDDIGAVVAALLAPENGWINAQRIEASGGQMI